MQGLEAAEKFFLQSGLPMLENRFAEYLPRIAAGLSGRGSECFGCDDDISRDHDFTTGFALYLTRQDEAEFGFALERAYRNILKTLPRPAAESQSSLFGGSEHGVIIIEDFFERHIGIPRAPESFDEWLNIPEYALAEAANGKLFCDNLGVMSAIRKKILYSMPEDIRLKKLAARAAVMAQSGQYNFMRCIRHGEPAAAALALDEFVRNAISMIFLLNFRFAPYYKWSFRAMRQLPNLADAGALLEELLTGRNDQQTQAQTVERIVQRIIQELVTQNLSSSSSDYLENHALEITCRIRSRELRSRHIMLG